MALHNILNTCGVVSGDLEDYGMVFGYLDLSNEDWLDDPDEKYDPDQIKDVLLRVYSPYITCVLYDDNTSKVKKHQSVDEMMDEFESQEDSYKSWNGDY